MTERKEKHYTPAEVAYIKSRYGVASCRTIASEMGRTRDGVYHVVKVWGLKRTAAQKSALYRTWVRRNPNPPQEASP